MYLINTLIKEVFVCILEMYSEKTPAVDKEEVYSRSFNYV